MTFISASRKTSGSYPLPIHRSRHNIIGTNKIDLAFKNYNFNSELFQFLIFELCNSLIMRFAIFESFSALQLMSGHAVRGRGRTLTTGQLVTNWLRRA
jgi:hypothetical protein